MSKKSLQIQSPAKKGLSQGSKHPAFPKTAEEVSTFLAQSQLKAEEFMKKAAAGSSDVAMEETNLSILTEKTPQTSNLAVTPTDLQSSN
ncbi:unnamed protein product [Linum trigynum]|uniref:Uncharacterized protein n=1 Tax=Linum trigynum TaxID=586398 RepID=A0AAV2CIE5_9ROSI